MDENDGAMQTGRHHHHSYCCPDDVAETHSHPWPNCYPTVHAVIVVLMMTMIMTTDADADDGERGNCRSSC